MAALRQHFMRQWERILFGVEKLDVIHFLQGRGLFSVRKQCLQCNRDMHLEKNNGSPDGYRW